MKQTRTVFFATLALLLILFGVGCNSNHTEVESSGDDNETKSMVLDILHTREGLESLKDIMRDPRLKQSLTITETDIQQATTASLADPNSHVQLTDQMKNPSFGSTVTMAYRKDNEAVLKQLMKDPEYQMMMLDILKSPDFQQTLYDLMKTPEYRQQAVNIMAEALQNPDFKTKFLDQVKQVIQQNPTGQQAKSQSSSQGQQPGQLQGEKKKDQSDDKQEKEKGKDQGSSEDTGS